MPPKKTPSAPPKDLDESALVPGAIVLYRLRGYPPWPSLVVTEEHIPNAVKKVKPAGNVYPVRFFPLDKKVEFAWANPKTGDIQEILSLEEIVAFNEKPKKVSKGCLEAYKAAAEPVDLEKLKMDDDEEMADADEDEVEEEEEDDDAALEDVKDLYDEDDTSGKKRKRADDDEEEAAGKKKKKSAVVVPPVKKRKAKAEQNGTPKPREKKPKAPKPKKAQVDSPKKKSAEDKAKGQYEYRKKEIMYIRHRIQKTLLDKSGKEPDLEELPGIVENLKKLADFNWVTATLIAETKMHKVLKRIIALPAIPQDETFDIKTRATEILKSWGSLLEEMSSLQIKKGSGSDTEKSPTKPDAPKDETEETKPDNEEKEAKDDADEEFVLVEGGGEVDTMAQEKAADAGAPATTEPEAMDVE